MTDARPPASRRCRGEKGHRYLAGRGHMVEVGSFRTGDGEPYPPLPGIQVDPADRPYFYNYRRRYRIPNSLSRAARSPQRIRRSGQAFFDRDVERGHHVVHGRVEPAQHDEFDHSGLAVGGHQPILDVGGN